MSEYKGKDPFWFLAYWLALFLPRSQSPPSLARILLIIASLLVGGLLGFLLGIHLSHETVRRGWPAGLLLGLPAALSLAYLAAHIGTQRVPRPAQSMMKTELGVTGREQPPRKPHRPIKVMRFEGRAGQIKNPSISLVDKLGSLPSKKSEHSEHPDLDST